MSWGKVRLGDVCEIYGGTTPLTSNAHYWNGDVVWLSPTDLPEIGEISHINNSSRKITNSALKASSLTVLPKGSVVYSTRASIGKIGIADVNLTTNQGFTNFVCKSDIFNKFLCYSLKYYTPQIAKLSNSTTFSEVSRTSIKNFKIPLPSISTQQRIAEILDKADALRKKDKQLLQYYDDLAQSLFIDMFGDPVRNEKSWEVKKLSDVAKKEKNSIVDGPFGSSVNDNDYCDDGIPVIRINNIREDGFHNGSFRFIKEKKYLELIRSKIDFNDILIARVGHTIGKSCLFNYTFKAMLSTTGVCKVSIDNTFNNLNFIVYQISMPSFKKYIKSQVQGAGQPYLNLTMIKGFKLITPPLTIQNQFAQQIQNIEQQKEKVKAQLQESEHLFQALLQQAFSGGLN